MADHEPEFPPKAEGAVFDDYAGEYQFWVEHRPLDVLLTRIRTMLPSGGVVLDAGCGEGILSIALSPFAHQIIGIDLSPTMIALAHQRAQAASADNVHFIIGDLHTYPLGDQSCDLAVSSFVLHHTRLEVTLPALARSVRPGGWLMIEDSICPVQGLLRPSWYRWQGLRAMRTAFQRHGLRQAWRIGRFQQSRAWMRHQLTDQHWNAAQWQDAVARLLPGAVAHQSADGAIILILWQCPQASTSTQAPSSCASLHGARPEAATPIRVGRHYPRPAPADYCAFSHAAIEGSVVARFEEQVAQHEAKPALRTPGLELSYGQLNAAANCVARRLLAPGRTNTPVAILMDQDDPAIPALLGVLKAGRAYVFLDPTDAPERLARILALTGAEALVTTAARAAASTMVDRVRHRVLWEDMDDASCDNPGLAVAAGDMAAVFFTSGSTGEPKGVARDHRQFLHSTWLNTSTYYVAPSDRQSLLYFPGFTASVPNIYDTLLNGATLCSLNPRQMAPGALLDWVRRERITHFNPPIGLWRGLLETIPSESRWPDLRLVTLAGQPLYGRDVRDFQARLGADTVLLYVLAMTEAGAVTQGYIDQTTVAGDASLPVGYPVADKEISILDEAGVPVAAGEVGRVAVSSAYLSRGYWQDEALTEAGFRPDAGDGQRRTFLTSDRGRLRSDGCLEHYGRVDSVVKVRGFRVDMGAVEAALNSHPLVAQAVVIARPNSSGEAGLVAYLVGVAERRPSIEELRTHLSGMLPSYMAPERFMWLETLPLTASGKVDRQALPPPGKARPDLGRPFVAPSSAQERQIADIWAELLEVDEVGIDDNFFALGGDSLLAMRMAVAVEKSLVRRVPDTFLRGTPTIANLVHILSGEPGEAPAAIRAASPTWTERKKQSQRRWTVRSWAGARLLRFMKVGPAQGGRAFLPYAAGIRLQRVLIAQSVVQRMFARELDTLRQWQEELSLPQDEQTRCINLLANTWRYWWRAAMMHPGAQARGMTLSGAGWIRFGHDWPQAAVVLAVPHVGTLLPPLEKMIQVRGRETALVVGDRAVRHRGDKATREMSEMHIFAAQLWEARHVLQRGGVVLIAGDGRSGVQTVDVPFRGRHLPFRIGAATLAVESDALFVPVFASFDIDGRIHVEVLEPLTSQAPTEDERITDLTMQYGRLYVARWPQFCASMQWQSLSRNLELPVL